jgi:RNA polymerase primary sigma factor
MNQQEFMQIISDLQTLSANQNGTILTTQITDKLGKDFTQEQLDAVFSYLKSQQCEIIDEKPASPTHTGKNRHKKISAKPTKMASVQDAPSLNVTEQTIYRSYLDELSGIEPCSLSERKTLIQAFKNGDGNAKNRLIEGHLHLIADWAKDYAGKGLAITDLIQEGNMALMLSITEDISHESFENVLYQTVTQNIETALQDAGIQIQMEETMAIRANRLMQISAELAEEYDREPTLSELAEKLFLPEDEVKEIMKMSMDAMTIEQSKLAQES